VLSVVVGQGVVHASMYGPLAALYSELFPTRSRYTGASLGYQVAGIGAGLAPVVFAAVMAGSASSTAVSAIIAACCLVSVGCILALGETSRMELTSEPGARDLPIS
jgi:MFS family permease